VIFNLNTMIMVKLSKVLVMIIVPAFAAAQNNSAIQDLLNSYNAAMESYDIYSKCGSDIDGALNMGKSMEDAALNLFVSVSLEEENQIGGVMFDTISKQYNIIPNPVMENAMAKILLDSVLTPYLKRPEISYKINLIQSDEINAFATAGGYVYITSGLLQFVESLDELAFIVAHEISHVDLEHTLDKYKRIMALGKLNGAGFSGMADAAYQLTFVYSTPFDQMDEYEADMSGLRIAAKAGFDVTKFADFFKRIEENEGEMNLEEKLSRSHPSSKDRVSCLEHHIQEMMKN